MLLSQFLKRGDLPYQISGHSTKTQSSKHCGTRQKQITGQWNMRKNSYIVRVHYTPAGSVQSACILKEE